MTDTEMLIESVAEADELDPCEKETIIKFTKADDTLSIYTEEGGLMRRLMQHPGFEIDSLRDSNGAQVSVNDTEESQITGVKGSIPIPALGIRTSLRTNSDHASIVSEAVLRGEDE